MPFTFAHPAIVLPLAKLRFRFLSVSALVIGSMTPDFEYFIKMKLIGRFSHTLPGVFIFCLPVGFVVMTIFHLIVKRQLINSLPSYFYSRLIPLRDFDFIVSFKKHFFTYTACLLTGILSHLLWDSFTHANHFMVRHIAWLSYPVNLPGIPTLPLFRYLQHISTVLGAVYLMYFFHKLPHQYVQNKVNSRYWLAVVTISLLVYLIRANQGFEYFGDRVSSAIGSFFIALVVTGLLSGLKKNEVK